MAQKVQVLLVDDLDGGEADETVAFSLDGTSYEIDLSSRNASKFRDSLASYVASARKSGRGGGSSGGVKASTRSRSGGGTATVDREQSQAIRSWAKSKGLKVSERGRIPASIVEQYHAEAG